MGAFLFFTSTFSQDILIKTSGDSITVNVLESGLTEIKYKKYEDPHDITYGILKTEVSMIRYGSGRIERFVDGKIAEDEVSLSPEEKCSCGKSDAAMYHGKKTGHFVLGLFFGPYAMIGTAIAKQTPQKGSHTYELSKNKKLFTDPYYLRCYRKKAKGDLLGMEAQGLIAGIVIPLAIIFLIYTDAD